MKKIIALGIIALSLAGTASAQVKPEDQIKYRQAGYSFMSWNMGKIKANLEGEYNAQQVQAAANAIAGIAGLLHFRLAPCIADALQLGLHPFDVGIGSALLDHRRMQLHHQPGVVPAQYDPCTDVESASVRPTGPCVLTPGIDAIAAATEQGVGFGQWIA